MKGDWRFEHDEDQRGLSHIFEGSAYLFCVHVRAVAERAVYRHNVLLRAAVEEERERCAEIAGEFAFSAEIVDAIRARGGGA